MKLQQYTEEARRAYYWTSFNPDQRGQQDITSYSEELTADLSELTNKGATAETLSKYEKRYISLLRKYWGSHSNVASVIITGPAKFPIERNRKRSDWAYNHYSTFRQWREKALKAIAKSLEPPRNELEEARKNLEAREKAHEQMKQANAVIRRSKSRDEMFEGIREIFPNFSFEQIAKIIDPQSFSGMGFARFELTNNLANIKRLRERVAILESKEVKKEMGDNKELSFEGGRIVSDYTEDRVMIHHDNKPEAEVIGRLKKSGFRWSPKNKAWQRKLTRSGIYDALRIIGLPLEKVYDLE